jgi:hypothetical protein
MEYVVGVIIAIMVGLFASVVGLDKERSFYSVVLIVIATYYLLFAVIAKSTEALTAEVFPVIIFAAAAVIGFMRTQWIVVVGLGLHGVFDFIHHTAIANPGVPVWWPGFCLAYDVTAAVYLAALLLVRRTSNATQPLA